MLITCAGDCRAVLSAAMSTPWAGQRTVEGKNGKNYEIGQANR